MVEVRLHAKSCKVLDDYSTENKVEDKISYSNHCAQLTENFRVLKALLASEEGSIGFIA